MTGEGLTAKDIRSRQLRLPIFCLRVNRATIDLSCSSAVSAVGIFRHDRIIITTIASAIALRNDISLRKSISGRKPQLQILNNLECMK